METTKSPNLNLDLADNQGDIKHKNQEANSEKVGSEWSMHGLRSTKF